MLFFARHVLPFARPATNDVACLLNFARGVPSFAAPVPKEKRGAAGEFAPRTAVSAKPIVVQRELLLRRGLSLFFGPCPRERVPQTVVSFVTGVLENRADGFFEQ